MLVSTAGDRQTTQKLYMNITRYAQLMKGIAISLYDKFDELAVFVDMIRSDWEDEYFISVCCAHPDGEEAIAERGITVDCYVQGGRVHFTPDMPSENGAVSRKGVNRTARILDSMFLACQAALSERDDVETVMHCHADAWPLSEQKLEELIEEMYARDRRLAIRGLGLEWREPNNPLGVVMDQFFIFDSEFAEERSLFDADPLTLLPHKSIHNALSILLLGRAGLDNIWYYSLMKDDLQWDGTPVELPYIGVRPGIYNPEWELLHIATDEFPDDLGKSVQAHYLETHGNWTGETVTSYIEEYHREDTFERVLQHEERLNDILKRRGFDIKKQGRKFSQMQALIEESSDSPLAAAKRFLKQRVAKELLFRFLSAIPAERFSHLGDPRTRKFYHDAEWPGSLVEAYRTTLDRDDFPDDMTFWFEGCYGTGDQGE